MFIYTENDIESHATLKTSIYNPKHTQDTKIHVIVEALKKIRKSSKENKLKMISVL